MTFIAREEPFTCEHCGADVSPLLQGSYRNHCPHCLYSKHVDDRGPGDRLSRCGGLMEPLHLDQDSKRGWMIQHRCTLCAKTIANRAAPDDEIILFMNRKGDSSSSL